ncbi:MAG: hypothetical protein IT383_01750 [Deltaproteobacteria bacterium]|nr:hypothetical protein [Deltaproteobacteria bacterium]
MSGRRKGDDDDDELGLGVNPLAEADPLVSTFYRAPDAQKGRGRRSRGRQPLKDGRTWRLVTFSFYEEDVRRLDALLSEAKRRGHRRVSRSQIVRLALRQVDLASLPEIV